MKIALVVHDYHRRGGHSRYVVELAERFSREHEVHVFANTFESDGKDDIKFHRVPAIRTTALTTILTFPLGAASLLEHQFDIIHAQGVSAPRQEIVTAHICNQAWLDVQQSKNGGLSLPQRLFKATVCPWERSVFRQSNSNWVIAVSEKLKREIGEYYERTEQVSVVRPGVDPERFHPGLKAEHRAQVRKRLSLSEDRFLMLYVGDVQKGADYAIRTAACVPESQLVVVSGSRFGDCRALAAKLGVADRVVFVPPTGHMEEYYAACDLFLFPTVYDGHGMVIWEAMASGLSVITSRAAGAAEIMDDLTDGVLVDDPSDTSRLAGHVRSLMADARRRQAMCEHARRKVEAYSWDRAAAETIKVYERVLDMKR
jgi:UDP-glucose:(heptosyl)LPS alpha-1,3-glucosyltransferase